MMARSAKRPINQIYQHQNILTCTVGSYLLHPITTLALLLRQIFSTSLPYPERRYSFVARTYVFKVIRWLNPKVWVEIRSLHPRSHSLCQWTTCKGHIHKCLRKNLWMCTGIRILEPWTLCISGKPPNHWTTSNECLKQCVIIRND